MFMAGRLEHPTPVASGLLLLANPARETVSFFAACRQVRQSCSLCAHFNRNACMTFHAFNLACYLLGKLFFGVRAPKPMRKADSENVTLPMSDRIVVECR